MAVWVGSRGQGRSTLLRALGRTLAAEMDSPRFLPIFVDLGGLEADEADRLLLGALNSSLGLPEEPGVRGPPPRGVDDRMERCIETATRLRPDLPIPVLLLDRLEAARRWKAVDRSRLRALLSGRGNSRWRVIATSLPSAGEPRPAAGSRDDILGAPCQILPEADPVDLERFFHSLLQGEWPITKGVLEALVAGAQGSWGRGTRLLRRTIENAGSREAQSLTPKDVEGALMEVEAEEALWSRAAGDADLPSTPSELQRALARVAG